MVPTQPWLVSGVLLALLLMMLGELLWSRRNERRLAAAGAVEAEDPVYGTMRWAYPALFALMALEGLWRGRVSPALTAGAALLVAAKVLKYWAIATLGERWTYKVIVQPGRPLVAAGPYRIVRHPNYVGVIGEILGTALLFGAWLAGAAAVLFFGRLLQRRIAAEERALGGSAGT